MISGAPLHENGTLNIDGRINGNEGRGPSVRFEGISLELSSFAGCRFDFAGDGILVLTFDGYKGVVTLKSTAQQQQHRPHEPLYPTGSEAGLLGVLEAGESLAMDHVDYDMALSQLEQGDSPQQHQHRQPSLSLSPVEVVSTETSPSPAGVLLFSSPSAVRQACEGMGEEGLKINKHTQGRDKCREVSATSIINGKSCPPSGPPSARQLDIENQRAPAATVVSPSSSLKNASHTINDKLAHKHKHARSTPLVENASATCTAGASSKTCNKKRSARARVGDGPKKASAEACTSAVKPSSKPRSKRARRGRDEPTPAAKAGGKSASVSSGSLICLEPTVEKENRAREDDGCAPEEASMVENNSNADGVPQQGARAGQGESGLAKEAMSPAASAAAAWIAAANPTIPSALSRSAKAQILEKGEDAVIPMGRWGHSATMVSETQMLVLGGQADDDAHQATLGDLHKFDFETCSWSRPMNCDSIPRAWHTASFIAGKNLLVIFGGERTVDGCPECLDDIMVLDTDIDLLYPPAISGKSPTARSGHSAAIIGTDLVVFGGVRGRKWQNNVAVLDTERWHWRHPTIDGSSPAPRSYHSATVVGPLMVVFGGNNQNESFDMVNVLDTGKSRWEWSRPEMVGAAPPPRTGHSAVLLPDGYTIVIHGGWDPEDEGGVKNFGDAYLLDTRLWEWSRGPETLLGTKDKGLRVGHTALLARGGQEDGEQDERGSGHDGVAGGWKAAFFGGQDGEGVRRSELALLSL